jgi:hypothetical protein
VYEARTALHEYADGRDMRCEDARESLSAGDRRMLRGRKLAAHMRDCASCRDFQEVMRLRSRDVAALAPPISAGASAAILQGIVGTSAGGGVGGGGLLAWISGSGAKAVLGSQAAKSLLAAALVTASAGALGVVSALQAPQGGREAVGPPRAVRDATPDAMTLRAMATGTPAPSRPTPAGKRTRRGAHEHAVSSPAPDSRPESPTGGSNGGTTPSHHAGPASQTAPATIGVVAPPTPPAPPTTPSLPQLTPTSIAETVTSLPATPTIAPPMLDFVAPRPALPSLAPSS